MNRIHRLWNQIELWFLQTPLGIPCRANPICGTKCACDSSTGCTARWANVD